MLDNIRTTENDISTKRKVLDSLLILALGVVLGVFSKALDASAFNELPEVFQMLDVTNLLGRFSIWIFMAVCISVYSSSAKRAALNVFLFFLGMVTSYYLYSTFVAGFFPMGYAMIWFGITLVSPFLAYICWYAKGKGWPTVAISGVIIGVLFSFAVFLFQGIRISYIPEVIIWLASLIVLRREPKEFAVEIGISVVVAALLQLLFPFLYG